MKIIVIKLGTRCTDVATGLEGMLTHWLYNLDGRVDYLFQPIGINPEDGLPIKKILLESARIKFFHDSLEEVEIPVEILGTKVTDKASGFSGMAVSFIRHINGCFHITIQPQGTLPKTNSPIAKLDFDLRQCEGSAIPQLGEERLRQSKEDRPSPTEDSFPERLPVRMSSALND